MPEFKLGDPISEDDKKRQFKQAPPVVLQLQPEAFILLETPEELRSWEEAMRQTTGLRIDAASLASGAGTESCSNGCTDDCRVDPC